MSVRGYILGFVATVSLLSPVSAFARDADGQRSGRTDDAVRTLEKLADPAVQKDMGNVLSALIGSLMQLRVGEIANAVEDVDLPGDARKGKRSTRRMDPNTTLADLAGKGDPDFAEKLDDDIRAMPKMAGALAGSLAQMLPMMDAMARDFEAQLDENLRKAKNSR
jgi:hypothetical protein